jgi:hypothetical protein
MYINVEELLIRILTIPECHIVCKTVCANYVLCFIFYILLTVHLEVILVNDQLDALFSMFLFHASTCFEQQVLIIRRIKICQEIIWYNPLRKQVDSLKLQTRVSKTWL